MGYSPPHWSAALQYHANCLVFLLLLHALSYMSVYKFQRVELLPFKLVRWNFSAMDTWGPQKMSMYGHREPITEVILYNKDLLHVSVPVPESHHSSLYGGTSLLWTHGDPRKCPCMDIGRWYYTTKTCTCQCISSRELSCYHSSL